MAKILKSDTSELKNQSYRWSLDWQMQSRVLKCFVIHMGITNIEYNYKLGENVIKTSKAEEDVCSVFGLLLSRRRPKKSGKINKTVHTIGMDKKKMYFLAWQKCALPLTLSLAMR